MPASAEVAVVTPASVAAAVVEADAGAAVVVIAKQQQQKNQGLRRNPQPFFFAAICPRPVATQSQRFAATLLA